MADTTTPQIGQNQYYKTTVNGNDVYTTLPWAGNVPQGYTALSKQDFITGLSGQIQQYQTLAGQLSTRPGTEGYFYTDTGRPYVGQMYNPQQIADLQKTLSDVQTGQGTYADTYKDPSLSNYLPNAPTPSEQYFTQQHFSTLAPGEQTRLQQAYPQQYSGYQTTPLQPGQNQVQLGNTFGITTGNPSQIPAPQPTGVPQGPGTGTGVQQPAQQTGLAASFPTVQLQPGMTGDAVKQLQDYLVSKGLMTQQDLAGGYGIYGPKTTAAVAHLQQMLGVDNSSGPGYFGPKTLAALQATTGSFDQSGGTNAGSSSAAGNDQLSGQSQTNSTGTIANQSANTSDFISTYTDTLNKLGIPSIKAQFDQITKQYGDLQNELNDKISNITDNPWMTQGVKDRNIQQLKDKYATKLDILTNQQKIYDSLYQEGVAQAKFLTSGEIDQQNRAADLAQQRLDAENKIKQSIIDAQYKNVREVNGGLYDLSSGSWLVPPKPGSTDSTGSSYTQGSSPIVDSWISNVLNGNATMQQVPSDIRNLVSLGLTQQGKEAYSPLADSRFTMAANRIVSNFVQLPQYQLTANGLPYLQRIDAAMKNPGSVSDQDLLDSFTKLNSSGNAITDAQVSIITGGKSFADAVNVWRNKLNGGGVLSSSQRQQIQTIAQQIYSSYQKGYQPVYDQVTAQLQEAGIPKAFWTIPDLNNLSGGTGFESTSTSNNLYDF